MPLKIEDSRFTYRSEIGDLPNEQVFVFNDKGSFGMIIEQDCNKGLTCYYSFGAHKIDWLIDSVIVTPVDARLVIGGGPK